MISDHDLEIELRFVRAHAAGFSRVCLAQTR